MTATMAPLAREGFHAPGIEEFEWPNIINLHLFGVNLGINRVVLQMFLVVVACGVFGLLSPRWRRRAEAP